MFKKKREIFFWVKEHPDMSTQCTDGESNKIVLEKKTAVTAWMSNTYRVRNHFVLNPVNPKLVRLKKN